MSDKDLDLLLEITVSALLNLQEGSPECTLPN